MKKIFFLVAISCICAGTFAQENLTIAQKSFQTSIINFLREEGYSPKLDEDNEINFKSESVSYWIRIFSESPYFIVFQSSGFTLTGEGSFDRTVSMQACNELNKKLNAIKMYCDKTMVFLQIEQYVRSAEDFKYVFSKNLNCLKTAKKEFYTQYKEMGGE